MKQNLYATSVITNKGGNKSNVTAGYYGATSLAESKGLALDRAVNDNPDGQGSSVVAIEIPNAILAKILAQHDESTRTVKCSDQTVTFKCDQATRDAVFEKVVQFFIEQESFIGEAIQQNDDPNIAAPITLAEIADDLMGFKFTDREP